MKTLFHTFIVLSIMPLLLWGCTPTNATEPPDINVSQPLDAPLPVDKPTEKYLSINSPEALTQFYEESAVIPFSLSTDDRFNAQFDLFLQRYNNSPNFEKTTAESFLSDELTTSNPLFYITDINNDGVEDFVFAYSFQGTGHYSGIDQVYTTEEGHLIPLMIPEPLATDLRDAYLLSFLRNDDQTYIHLSTHANIDTLYTWKNDRSTLSFSDQLFVDNHSLDLEDTDFSSAISEKYHVPIRLLALENQNIDYSNSGYSNEAVLLTYYKIKDAILNEDARQLSKCVKYPLIIWHEDGAMKKIYGPDDFVKAYSLLVTPHLVDIVENSTDDTLFSNYQGVMIGNGEIWFTTSIITIQ